MSSRDLKKLENAHPSGEPVDERYFYHSFPRARPDEDADIAIEKGLKILRAVADFGLVLAPEVVEWKIPLSDGSTKAVRHRQARICFTELSRSELSEHGKRFGAFSLEFRIEGLRSLGAMPVIYVPQALKADSLFSPVGPAIVWMLEMARHTLDQLHLLSQWSDPSFILQQARGDHPDATGVAPNLKMHLRNCDREKNVVREFEIDANTVRDFLRYLNFETAPFEAMRGAIHAAQMLFYPTDDERHDLRLSYYRQREWRIFRGPIMNEQPLVRPANQAEKDRLIELDEWFWSKELVDDQGSFRRVDEAYVVNALDNARISELVRTVIVPPSAFERSRDIFGDKVEQVG